MPALISKQEHKANIQEPNELKEYYQQLYDININDPSFIKDAVGLRFEFYEDDDYYKSLIFINKKYPNRSHCVFKLERLTRGRKWFEDADYFNNKILKDFNIYRSTYSYSDHLNNIIEPVVVSLFTSDSSDSSDSEDDEE